MDVQIQLFQFAKDENEEGVRCTCFIVIGGEQKGTQQFTIPESALPTRWDENDLIVAINKSEDAVRLGMTVIRMPKPKASEE